ncbi:MAG: 50S ribosomal protein L5 [Candidatus Yonathbacteria bacterium]|nr:50S ribosomal protein L5 [Candidatus Yonathbacteria bacterium]
MESVKVKEKKAFSALKEKFGYKNPMAAPRLLKVIVSSTTGSSKQKGRNELVAGRLAKITGQKPSLRGAKKSIASFKLREGEKIGVIVTLRKERMYGFLDKFINIASPRTRDFRGYNRKSIDIMGNLTLGLKEQTIFPETVDEDLKDVFGMSITIVTSAKNKDEAGAFFELLGIPFKKQGVEEEKKGSRKKKK